MSIIRDINIAISEGDFQAEIDPVGLRRYGDRIFVWVDGILLQFGEGYHWEMRQTDIDEYDFVWLRKHEILSDQSLKIIKYRILNDADMEQAAREGAI